MIDTHAHLDFPEFDQDREEVIRRAFDNGLKAIINVGVDLERSRKSIEIAEKHEGVFASVGLHPDFFTKHVTRNTTHNWVNKLKNLAKHEKVIVVGEAGLDYFRITHNLQREMQKEGFVAQINLAHELGLPVIVHCRDAWEDAYDIIKSEIQKNKKIPNTKYQLPATKFVLHCYSGEKKDTEKFLELPNVHFSFSGNITYPKPKDRHDKLTEAVKMIPLDKIMLDSDAPFLAPQEMRGKRNEPIFVKYIAKKLAEMKGISEEETEKATDENACNLYELRMR